MKSKTENQMIAVVAALTAGFLMSACSTIHFDNGPVDASSDEATTGEMWYHDGALALVEFSDPVELNEICGSADRWTTVQIQQNVVQSILTGITATLYAPWDVQYSCVKKEKRRKRKHHTG